MASKRSIPSSLNAIHIRIQKAYELVNSDVQIFVERYLTHIGDTDTWLEFVEALCEREGRKAREVDTFSEFEIFLDRAKGEPEISHEPEYQQLRDVCERGRMFDYIVHSLKNNLHQAFEQELVKYCLSFAQEAKGVEVGVTQDYENKIIDWKQEIKERFEYLQTVIKEEKEYESPISKYVKKYDRVIYLMEETCKTLLAICVPMKKWVIADTHYTRKIQDEINSYNRIRLEMRDTLSQMEYTREQLANEAKGKAFRIRKIHQHLIEQGNERKRFRRRHVTIQQSYDRTVVESEKTKHDLEVVLGHLQNRQWISPRGLDMLSAEAEIYRVSLKKQDKKLRDIEFQIRNLKKDQDSVDKEIARLQIKLETHVKQQEEATEKVQVIHDGILHARKVVAEYDGKIAALKRVRELKLHSDTVKKIYHYGYSPEFIYDIKDELEEAFRLAAPDVGKDWMSLYHRLPFKPQRDFKTRSQDIEVIDLSNHRLDVRGFEHLVLKSLEKWKRLSSLASVPQLIDTLRSIKKNNAVRNIINRLQIEA